MNVNSKLSMLIYQKFSIACYRIIHSQTTRLDGLSEAVCETMFDYLKYHKQPVKMSH